MQNLGSFTVAPLGSGSFSRLASWLCGLANQRAQVHGHAPSDGQVRGLTESPYQPAIICSDSRACKVPPFNTMHGRRVQLSVLMTCTMYRRVPCCAVLRGSHFDYSMLADLV